LQQWRNQTGHARHVYVQPKVVGKDTTIVLVEPGPPAEQAWDLIGMDFLQQHHWEFDPATKELAIYY